MGWTFGATLNSFFSFDRFSSIISWIGDTLSYSLLALFVSIFALAVAIWSARLSQKNLRQVESQTKSAYDANMLSHKALERADLSIESGIESRAYDESPQIVVAIPEVPTGPVIHHYENPYPSPHPEPDYESQPKSIDLIDHWFFEIYYLIRGSLLNSGDHAVLVLSQDMDFVQGESMFSEGSTREPLLVDRSYGKYLLEPGQEASFEWRVGGLVEFWTSIERGHLNTHALRGSFVFFPLKAGAAVYTIDMKVDAHPFSKFGSGVRHPREIIDSRSTIIDISAIKAVNVKNVEDLRKERERSKRGDY